MSKMGIKIEQFDVPVCNSFRAKIIKDQLCCTVDPNLFRDKNNLKGELYMTLFIDYNEERQFEDNSNNDEENFVKIDTIGSLLFKLY